MHSKRIDDTCYDKCNGKSQKNAHPTNFWGWFGMPPVFSWDGYRPQSTTEFPDHWYQDQAQR